MRTSMLFLLVLALTPMAAAEPVRLGVAGLTHEELPELAEKVKADVVVMGAVARSSRPRNWSTV